MNIEELLQQTQALPSIPKVVQELIQGLSKDDVLTSEISQQLAADQVLSAKVLRLANSAYYNVPRTVSTVDEALKLLGFLTVRTLVMTTGVAGSFQNLQGIDLKRFWRYSLHTAVAAKYFARGALLDTELAFTVGLLHGIGRLVMHAGMPEAMAAASLPASPFPDAERIAAERQVFGYSFADVGAELARRWNFPEVFAEAIRGAAEPLEKEPVDALHGLVHIAAWCARVEELQEDLDTRAESFPDTVADKIGQPHLRETVFNDMPPIAELAEGLEEMVAN